MIDHETMRTKNLGQIFEQIRKSKPHITKRELQAQTGMSWATISGSIKWLLQEGFVVELDNDVMHRNGAKPSNDAMHSIEAAPCNETVQKAGRPAKAYDINPEKNLLIGVDINVESIQVVLIDMKCRVLNSINRVLIVNDKDSILELTKEMIQAIIDDSQAIPNQSQKSPNLILGIGFALMGAVDSTNGVALYMHLIRNWQNVDIKTIFEKEFGLPVLVEHDPNCYAIAEMNNGMDTRYNNMVFLRLSLGIGMCQVVSGRVFKGSTGNAGEIGHVCMDRNGPLCYCGKRGCVEAYASISGIARRYMEATGDVDGPATHNSIEDTAIVQRLAAAAASEDQNAKAYFNKAGEVLGLAIGNMISLNNPSMVVIGGALAQYEGLYMDRLRQVAGEICWPYSKVDIALTSLQPNGAAVGAAALFVQQRVWEGLF